MIAVGTMTASEVPLATTGDKPSTNIMTGTMMTPPPMPSSPASTPATTPVATSTTPDPKVSACCVAVSSSNTKRAAETASTPANPSDNNRLGARANHAVPISVPTSDPTVSAIAAPTST